MGIVQRPHGVFKDYEQSQRLWKKRKEIMPELDHQQGN